MKRRKYKKNSIVNNTGYTPGYKSELNPINIIPSENITTTNTPYPLQAIPLDEYGNPIGKQTLLMPGNEYNFPGASYVAEVPQFQAGGNLAKYGDNMFSDYWNSLDFSEKEKEENNKQYEFLTNWYNNRKFILNDKNEKINIDKIKLGEFPSVSKGTTKPFSLGEYDLKNNDVTISNRDNDVDNTLSQHTYTHELNHAYQGNINNQDKYFRNGVINSQSHDIFDKRYGPKATSESEYMYSPDEVHSRLMQFRYDNNIKPTDVITPKSIKNMKNKNVVGEYDDKQLMDMLNQTVYSKSTSTKNLSEARFGGQLKEQYQAGGVLLTSPKGNKLTTSEWDTIKTKGVWTNPQDYLDYIDGWAKPDSVVDPTSPIINLGQGSNRIPVPAQDVIKQLKSSLENKDLTKFYTKNDWDFENLGNLQGQLDSEYRKNDAGFNLAIGNLSQKPIKKEEPITNFLASAPKFQFGGEQQGWAETVKSNMNPTPTFGIGPMSQFDTTSLSLQNTDTPYQSSIDFKPSNEPVADNEQEQQRKQFVQFNNPYGDVDLNSSLLGLGESVKSGDAAGIATYGANTLLKSAKGFLSGFGAENRSQQNMKGFYDKFRENITGENNATYMQDGGEQQAVIEQQVAQALQGGADPQAVLAQLVQSGMDQAQATQLIQAIIQQLQGHAQESPQGENQEQQQEPQMQEQAEPMMQDGGQLTEKEKLQEKTGEYVAPLPEAKEGEANAEIERNEYILDSKGVRKAMGETHEQGGTPVKLEEGTKVLSDHLEVGSTTAKQLSEKLGTKVKASDTYAKVVDIYNKKSGLEKTNTEIEGLVKLLEKQQSDVKDENTSNLNTQFLIGQIKKQTEEKLPIEKERETLFHTLFDLQEKSKKPEKSIDDLDKMENGGMIKELAIKYNIPMDKVLELLPKYQAGGVSVNNTNNTFSNAPADETWLPYTPIEDTTNSLWQGNNYKNQWEPLVEQSMASPENAKQIEEWLLNKTGDYGKNVKKQLEGLQGEERTKRIIALATDQKPGPFHNAFLQAVKETVAKPASQKVDAQGKPIDEYSSRNSEVENVQGNLNLPVRPLNMPTWTPSLKTSTRLNTIVPALISPEEQIAENDRAVLGAQAGLEELSPAQRAIANIGLTANEISANNKAIQEANRFNAQAENSANVYNARVGDTEQQAENQNALNYEARTLKGLGAFENDYQNMLSQKFRDQTNNWKAVEIFNQNNALNPSVQFDGDKYIVNTLSLADLDFKYTTPTKEENKKKSTSKKKYGGRFKK